MALWTNYDPSVGNPGDKSLIPNEYGYVLPSGSRYGDALIAINDLLEASGNFEKVAGTYSAGSHLLSDYLVVAFTHPSVASQQYMFLLNSSNVTSTHGYTFDQSMGHNLAQCISIAGRDTLHTNSPTSFKHLEGTYDHVDGFFPNPDDAGSMGYSRTWDSYATTQDMRIYLFSDDDWAIFVYLYDDWNIYKSGHVLYRMSEPSDGHYTRADDGAVHGLLELKTTSNYHNRLAGVKNGYTVNSQVSGAFYSLGTVFPAAENDDEDFIQHLILGHSSNSIDCHLGTLRGLFVGVPGINLSIFDAIDINGKEYRCIQRDSPYFTLFIPTAD